jgi:hypothetical protein
MRFAVIEGHPTVYALDDSDSKGVSGPSELLEMIYLKLNEHTRIQLRGVELKDCKNCDNMIDGECDYSMDPTYAFDKRFCKGFEWRER